MTAQLLRERYEPLGVVGRGGEGEVIRALDHLHSRQVALKVRAVSNEVSRAELLSEARVLLSLSPHPGLPLVREDFFDGDRYVIAMDWIEGTDLEGVLDRDGRPGLEPALVLTYLEQAAEALGHLHMHDPSVVHGDVKPANLILTSSGRVVLVDFGLSSTPADELRRAGTAGYVAPEVAAGSRPTAAADVYSLAATALVLLTGEPPAHGAAAWGALEPARVPALERILRQSLAVDPARREASAAALVARLRRWWGADLPSGTVTLVLSDLGDEQTLDHVAREHGGHAVAPADDGPLLAAFASVSGACEAARALAAAGARVAVATREAAPRGGRYDDAPAMLLGAAQAAQVVVDEATAAAIGDVLPSELGLAEAGGAWMLVAPGLAAPPRAEGSPYRGLLAFQADDGDLFFGREEVVAAILERLLADRFMGVVGASGSGKSSLVRAGVVPAFGRAREGQVVVMTPGAHPAIPADPPALLVVDQLEEAFTLCRDDANRARFLDGLVDLWEDRSTAVVVALRADFYGQCANHPRLAAALGTHHQLLGPMQPDELRRAVEGPARAAGLRLERGLLDAMVADVDGEPGALPLLSHALYEVWSRREGRVLTSAGYRAAGGVRGAIAHTAEAVFLDGDEREQEQMRRMLLALTELGEGTEDTRRRVRVTDLQPEAGQVLERLTASRLVVVDDGSVEVAHEALIREWPRLRGWLTEDRDELLARRQLAAAARAWGEAGRNDADLLRGPRLAAAAGLAGELSGGEQAFLDASGDAQQRELTDARRRARRLRALLAAVVVALVAASIAGAFALAQRGSARRSATVAQAGRLAAESSEVAAEHPDLALLLALEGDRLDDSVDSRGALLGALQHGSRIRAWLQGFDAPVEGTAFSPDGKLAATVGTDGTTLWDTATWRRAAPPLRSAQGRWQGVDFSPDGRTLAIAGGEGRVELWDVATRKELRELTDPVAPGSGDRALSTVRFSPDGAVVAAGPQEENHVTLWSTKTGRVIGRPITTNPPGSGAQSIDFSPDSKRIAVPGASGTVGMWEVTTGRRVGKPLRIGAADVDTAIFADGGRRLIASDDAGSVSMVDVATGRLLGRPLSVGDEPAGSLALSPDGRLLAAGSFAGSVFVWDTATGARYGPPLAGDTSPVNHVAFSPDGRTLVSSHLRSAVVWNTDGVQAVGAPLGGPGDSMTGVAFSPDGRWLLAGQLDGGAILYDAATRRQIRRVEVGSIVSGVAFHPDGNLFAVSTIDGRIRLFDRRTGAPAGRPLDVRDAAVWQVAFSPDGRLLAAAVDPNGSGVAFYGQKRDGEVRVWDVASRRPVGRAIVPGRGSVLSLAFDPEGSLLATASYRGQLDLWDTATHAHRGEPMRVAEDGFPSVAFDPSGKLVAAGGATGPVRVWRVSDQRAAYPPLAAHAGGVTGAAFDANGSLLATTTLHGGTRLWDAATGRGYGDELAASPKPGLLQPEIDLPFLGLRNAFSPDGRVLATPGVDARTMLWQVDPAVWRRRGCEIAGRNLTRQEWRLHLPSGKPYRATCAGWPTD